jgi:hypothetical protein
MSLIESNLTNIIIISIVFVILISYLNRKEGFGNFVYQQPKRTVYWNQKDDDLVVGHHNCASLPIINFRIPSDMGALKNLTLDLNITTPKGLEGKFSAGIYFNGKKISDITGNESCQRKLDMTWLMKWTYGTEYPLSGDYHRISVVSCTNGIPIVVSNASLKMCYHVSAQNPKLGWYNGPN